MVIEPAVLAWGSDLSAEVSAAVPEASSIVVELLARWEQERKAPESCDESCQEY